MSLLVADTTLNHGVISTGRLSPLPSVQLKRTISGNTSGMISAASRHSKGAPFVACRIFVRDVPRTVWTLWTPENTNNFLRSPPIVCVQCATIQRYSQGDNTHCSFEPILQWVARSTATRLVAFYVQLGPMVYYSGGWSLVIYGSPDLCSYCWCRGVMGAYWYHTRLHDEYTSYEPSYGYKLRRQDSARIIDIRLDTEMIISDTSLQLVHCIWYLQTQLKWNKLSHERICTLEILAIVSYCLYVY